MGMVNCFGEFIIEFYILHIKIIFIIKKIIVKRRINMVKYILIKIYYMIWIINII